MSKRTLLSALEALSTVRSQLVVVGGMAHSLFPLHELGVGPNFELLTTEDVDLATPLDVHCAGGDGDLLQRLREARFEERVRGGVEPKYTYHPAGDDASYIEFLAHLGGSGTTRDGTPDRLLHRPWTVSGVGSGDAGFPCQVVNPLAYLLQKLLVLPNRRGGKQAKDVLYVYDTLTIFGDSLGLLAEQASQLVPSLAAKQTKAIRAAAQRWCFEESEATRGAAEIAQSQRAQAPFSAQIAGACRLGLRSLFGACIPEL